MKCFNCINLDKDYDIKDLKFPFKRCHKNVITLKIDGQIHSINKKCDFFKVV